MRDANKPHFVKLLYNHNPFYLISAALILYGFRNSFQESTLGENPWLLVGLFSGYITLLAFTGWLIVKFGRVWDDARSIFMVLLLLFMALSTSIDGIFVTDPETALAVAFAGFGLAVIVTESLTHSLGIRFRWLYRSPLYAMLALSYFFPYIFTMKENYWPTLDDRFIILLFPFAVSLSILSLIPSIRQTKRYASKNGTPWRWPLYPYSIFVLLIVGLIGRTVLLTLSFDASIASGMLGTWMFVPILFALLWIIFEVGAAEEIQGIQIFALGTLPASLLLATAWPAFSNTDFYDLIQREIGSPVWLTLLVLIAIYSIAWFDNVKTSGHFLIFAICLAAILQPNGEIASNLDSVQVWPCMTLAVAAIGSSSRIRQSKSWFLSTIAIAFPATKLAAFGASSLDNTFRFEGLEVGIIVNLVLLSACIVVCVFRDSFSRKLSACIALVWPILATAAVTFSFARLQSSVELCVYCALLGLAAISVAWLRKSRLHLMACGALFVASFVSAIPILEIRVASGNQNLIKFIAAGFLCFLIGFLVSAIKAGWTKSTKLYLKTTAFEFKHAFVDSEKTLGTEQSV